MMRPMQLGDNVLRVRNPGASLDLELPVEIIPELPDDVASRNCRENVELDVPWLTEQPAHDGVAIVCGSAPSLKQHYADIRELQAQGAKVFACNAAARLLHEQGVRIEHQVLMDGNLLTLPHLFPQAECHLLASILPGVFFERSGNAVLWHPDMKAVVDVVDGLPRNFTYIGGAISVSMYTLCIAYTLGYRRIRCFGIDSSFDGEHFHVDDCSPVGEFIVDVEHNGLAYRTTYDMKAQAWTFVVLEQKLHEAGVDVQVFGTGLLPDAWRHAVSERGGHPSPLTT